MGKKIEGKKSIQGKVSISRYTSSHSNDGVTIRVEAENGVHIAEIELTIEQFGNAVTGRSLVECKVEVFESFHLIDKEYQHETVVVDIPKNFPDSFAQKNSPAFAKALAKLIAPYEVDGWKMETDQWNNGHRRKIDHTRGVTTVELRRWRFVDAT